MGRIRVSFFRTSCCNAEHASECVGSPCHHACGCRTRCVPSSTSACRSARSCGRGFGFGREHDECDCFVRTGGSSSLWNLLPGVPSPWILLASKPLVLSWSVQILLRPV